MYKAHKVRNLTMLDECLNHHTEMIAIGLSNSVSRRWRLLNSPGMHECCIVVGNIAIYIFDSVYTIP